MHAERARLDARPTSVSVAVAEADAHQPASGVERIGTLPAAADADVAQVAQRADAARARRSAAGVGDDAAWRGCRWPSVKVLLFVDQQHVAERRAQPAPIHGPVVVVQCRPTSGPSSAAPSTARQRGLSGRSRHRRCAPGHRTCTATHLPPESASNAGDGPGFCCSGAAAAPRCR